MSRWSVEFTREAAEEVRRLEPVIRRRVLAALSALEDDPKPVGCRTLAGFTDAWRIRIGDHRVLYELEEEVVLITVFRVAHRREVYR